MTLVLILHIFVGATLAGIAVITALLLGAASLATLLFSALAGFLLAFPVSWLVARRIAP